MSPIARGRGGIAKTSNGKVGRVDSGPLPPQDCPDCTGYGTYWVTMSNISGNTGGSCYTCAAALGGASPYHLSNQSGDACAWFGAPIDGSPFQDFNIQLHCSGDTWTLQAVGGTCISFVYEAPNTTGQPPATGWVKISGVCTLDIVVSAA